VAHTCTTRTGESRAGRRRGAGERTADWPVGLCSGGCEL